jgi:AraC-like DNA-binding protein
VFWIVLKAGRGFLGLPAAQGRALGEALTRIPARQFKAHPEVEPLLRETLEMLSASRDTLGQAALAATILRYLFKTIEAASALDRPPVSAPVARVLTWIEANPEDPSPVETLAAVAGLSAARFKTRFKQEVGVPPREYVLRQKIKVARMLLGAGSVTDTAFQLGFSSSQYFATVFRRFTGESPTEFLRKNASAARPG